MRGALFVNRLIVGCRPAQSDTVAALLLKGHVGNIFWATLSTYFLKFPIFEVINAAMALTTFSSHLRSFATGLLFCTITLPITNYRYYTSMHLNVKPSLVYQAYLPTLARDTMYSWSRECMVNVMAEYIAPESKLGKVFSFGVAIFMSCIFSSPCNEWRGYTLLTQGRGQKQKSFREYFKPVNYARSTAISASIMGISLMAGMLLAPLAEHLFSLLEGYRRGTLAVGIICAIVTYTRCTRARNR